MNNHVERNILIKLQSGSSEAFEELFHIYGGKLYNFILRITSGDAYLAEELVQRTFIKIWESHASVNPNKSFISYLCTIAKNMLLNEYEHQVVEFIYRDYITRFSSGIENDTEKIVNKNILEEYIDSLIEKLPPARKQVFILSRKEMLSNKEISEKLQISERTVQTQISRAISFMKEHLAKYYDQILSIVLIHVLVN
ncbi:MAG: RNA polymerase sigma-70 factor [Dysgonamonadaceae bacterium]